MSNPPAIAVRGLQGLALAIILPLLAAQPASAQSAGQNSLFSAAPATGLLAPGSTVRGDVFGTGGVLAPQAEWPPQHGARDRADRGADGAGRDKWRSRSALASAKALR